MSIDEIIKKKGQKFFEGAQRFAVTNLFDFRNCLISTGGNTFCDEYNRELLKKDSVTVWLRAKAETIYENTKNSRNKRPEIFGASLEEIEKMVNEKEKYYEDCDIVIDVDNKDIDEISDIIVNEFTKRKK